MFFFKKTKPKISVTVSRLQNNPIITPELCESLGDNINGPSLIKVPEWINNKLGNYYLYFAHHRGKYIRLAYADCFSGPWTIYKPGVLHLENSAAADHVASPDVHVNNSRQEIWMYYHGFASPNSRIKGQVSFVAFSRDGLNFITEPEILGRSYFRVFHWQGYYYALSKGIPNPKIDNFSSLLSHWRQKLRLMYRKIRGYYIPWKAPTNAPIYRSLNGINNFEEGPKIFDGQDRHFAVKLKGNTLYVFYTRIGDAPERILLSTIQLRSDWLKWKKSTPITVLEPEMDYEGSDLEVQPSRRGKVTHRVRQLRDPCIFSEDGQDYLLYSIAGEQGIAIAKIWLNYL